MPSEFRFLLICLGATHRLDDDLISLSGIVNFLECSANDRTDLAAIVGVCLRPEMKDKSLDLMAWRLDRTGERQRIPEYAGTPLILPDSVGPAVLPYSISLPTPSSGIYGFELFDRDGAFGPPEALLSTYMFGVTTS